MKRTLLVSALAAATLLSACAPSVPKEPPPEVAQKVVAERLLARGKLCLWGPSVWPLDIAKSAPTDSEHRPKILRQLGALEKVGLVEAHDAVAWELKGDKYVKSQEAVTRYTVTDFGRHFLRLQPSAAAEKEVGIEHADLCYATMALDTLIDVTNAANAGGYPVAMANFTYKTPIVVPWVKDPAIQRAYAQSLGRALEGAGSEKAQMPLVKVKGQWEVFEPTTSADLYHVRH